MLTLPERIIFALAVLLSSILTYRAAIRIIRIIQRGHGRPDWNVLRHRLLTIPPRIISFQPLFRFRFLPSLFHALIGWGFLYYVIVNIGDFLQAYFRGFQFLGSGIIANVYHLGADIFSVAVVTGMVAMIIRRFVLKSNALTARSDILLHPKARRGIRRDSLIVGAFVTLHVSSRLLGESFKLAGFGSDPWQPFASMLSHLWLNWSLAALTVGEHASFWVSLGLILAFLPYFLYSKHIHLFFAPLNFLLKPTRRSIGELSRLDLTMRASNHSAYLTWKTWVGNSSWMHMPASCAIAASRFARLITPARCSPCSAGDQ